MKLKKRIPLFLIAALLAAALCGCGATEVPAETVDLQKFMEDTLGSYELGSVEAVSGELLDAFYPGLSGVDAPQRVVYMPMITGIVSEYALLECADRDAAAQAAEILEARVQTQAEGGAWYPESVENWAKAKVITKGNYVAMIAAGELTDSIAADFEKLF